MFSELRGFVDDFGKLAAGALKNDVSGVNAMAHKLETELSLFGRIYIHTTPQPERTIAGTLNAYHAARSIQEVVATHGEISMPLVRGVGVSLLDAVDGAKQLIMHHKPDSWEGYMKALAKIEGDLRPLVDSVI